MECHILGLGSAVEVCGPLHGGSGDSSESRNARLDLHWHLKKIERDTLERRRVIRLSREGLSEEALLGSVCIYLFKGISIPS